mmetsp:Transcript_2355/g.7489  ORF Transcript_2355/g.7489 Transcript_2355/m.7489 type:complete len:702 (+) Transcript_2355:1297-3402(+)
MTRREPFALVHGKLGVQVVAVRPHVPLPHVASVHVAAADQRLRFRRCCFCQQLVVVGRTLRQRFDHVHKRLVLVGGLERHAGTFARKLCGPQTKLSSIVAEALQWKVVCNLGTFDTLVAADEVSLFLGRKLHLRVHLAGRKARLQVLHKLLAERNVAKQVFFGLHLVAQLQERDTFFQGHRSNGRIVAGEEEHGATRVGETDSVSDARAENHGNARRHTVEPRLVRVVGEKVARFHEGARRHVAANVVGRRALVGRSDASLGGHAPGRSGRTKHEGHAHADRLQEAAALARRGTRHDGAPRVRDTRAAARKRAARVRDAERTAESNRTVEGEGVRGGRRCIVLGEDGNAEAPALRRTDRLVPRHVSAHPLAKHRLIPPFHGHFWVGRAQHDARYNLHLIVSHRVRRPPKDVAVEQRLLVSRQGHGDGGEGTDDCHNDGGWSLTGRVQQAERNVTRLVPRPPVVGDGNAVVSSSKAGNHVGSDEVCAGGARRRDSRQGRAGIVVGHLHRLGAKGTLAQPGTVGRALAGVASNLARQLLYGGRTVGRLDDGSGDGERNATRKPATVVLLVQLVLKEGVTQGRVGPPEVGRRHKGRDRVPRAGGHNERFGALGDDTAALHAARAGGIALGGDDNKEILRVEPRHGKRVGFRSARNTGAIFGGVVDGRGPAEDDGFVVGKGGLAPGRRADVRLHPTHHIVLINGA